MIRLVRPLLYIIAFLLCAWYLLVFYWVLNPAAGIEYRLYYIERSLTDWPGYGGLEYDWGQRLYFGTMFDDEESVKQRGQGWEYSLEDGAWTDGEYSELLFLLDSEESAEGVTLYFMASAWEEQELEVLVNGNSVGTFEVIPLEYYEYEVAIPKEILADNEPDIIVFANRSDNAGTPEFGVFFVYVEMIPFFN